MKKETIKNIFDFLQEKGEHRTPFLWKWKNNIPLTKEDLNVQGDLKLSRSDITSLPEGLKVGGDLDLWSSKITSLPKGLEVGGTLYLYKSALVEYTDKELRNMVKPGFLKGDIYRG